MLNILIVDDDFLVRTYLQQFIDWEKHGYHIIGEAKDGKKAYEKAIETIQPDIIITDVCMPVMGGVELVRELKKIKHKAHIIVLSCHDDFEYVKEAMRLGADEYLLKNDLQEDKLLQILDKLRSKINQCEKNDKKDKKLLGLGREKLYTDFVRYLKNDSINELELDEILQNIDTEVQFTTYTLLVIVTKDVFSKFYLSMCLESISNEKYPLESKFMAVKLDESKILLVVDFKHVYNESVKKETLKKIYIKIRKFSMDYFSVDISLAIGCLYKGKKSLGAAYKEVEHITKEFFYEEKNILYADQKEKISNKLPDICGRFLSEMTCDITREIYQEKILELIIKIKEEKTDPKILLEWFRNLDNKLQIIRDAGFYLKIKNVNILETILFSYSLSMKNKKSLIIKHSGIKMALDYIEQHYMEDLSLPIISEKVSLSPAYFSYLFKNNLGITFLEYITTYRIEKVKLLMLDNSKKLNEIAKCAGFFDYRHFCKVFKNITGKSPKNYRESILLKSNKN